MRISIDNLDGLGAVDYTGAVAAEGKLRIERTLNAPSRCTAEIVEGVAGLGLPVRRGRVVVTAEDDGATVLFTGYVATEPVRMYAGEASAGAVYRARVTAVSDEWLLDKQGSGAAKNQGVTFALDGLGLLERLTNRAQSGGSGIAVGSGGTTRAVGGFATRAAVPWSVNAGDAAGGAYAGYRALAGEVLLQPVGSVTHVLSDADGTLDVHALQVGAVRELANDVTLSGEEEPAAIVSEIFVGDGATTVFTLSDVAFRGSARSLIEERFEQPAFDTTQWAAGDPGSHFSLTSAGLTMNGGNGADGQTTLTCLDAVEMGGTIVVELGSVVLGAASDGMLAGMYAGAPMVLANCLAGFRVRQSVSGTGGVTLLVPVVDGVEVGSTFTPVGGHKYTLRLRLHCVEMQRVLQQYYTMVDGVVLTFGNGSAVGAPMDVVFELVDEGAASNTPATVLYDSTSVGPIGVTSGTCIFVAANSTQIFGSVGSVSVTRPGSIWVTSTLPGGATQTRLMGVAGEGVDCVVEYGVASKVTFLAGRVPIADERVTVMYRGQRRSVARLADAASVAAEASSGTPGTSRWLGKVLQPATRSSVDCENAAEAVLAFSTSRTAAVAGTYVAVNPGDIWPGDVLSVTSEGVTSALLVRSVAVDDGGAVPEVRRYSVAFANDWATEWSDGLGLKLSEQIADDAILPQTALSAPGAALATLPLLSVTSLSTIALGVDAGVAAPVGGGFEVRRRDWDFGAGSDSDLVLRSPVRNFSIPRAAQMERYFVRMYDASSVYSRFSSAVFVNAPVA